jgi:nicotinamide phosphoribosyltransferase
MNNINSILLTDAYKLSHHMQYPENTTLVFSNFTPRSDKHAPKACQNKGIITFGIQMVLQYIKEHFDQNFFFTKERGDDSLVWNAANLVELKKKAIDPVKKELDTYLNTDYDMSHFEKLWDLGYLPLEVRALDEGVICPIKVPMLTIHNTLDEFYWLPNFLETIISNLLWKPITSATIALSYRQILEKWADKTSPESKEFVLWQGHDFSFRGLDSIDATIFSGLGHLTSFYGTDSLPTVSGARYYYDTQGFVAGSVPATEHSVMCAGSKEDELGTFRRLLQTYPNGILSVVSDTWDLWNVATVILPALKDEIMSRDGKLVIRPDSGKPADILCGESGHYEDIGKWYKHEESPVEHPGYFEDYLLEEVREDTPHGEHGATEWENTYIINGKLYHAKIDNISWNRHDKQYYYIDMWEKANIVVTEVDWIPQDKGIVEILWDVFGGTINEQGYKVLDSHIGAIYGDSITLEIAEEICSRLEAKGFASTNVVLGIGSFTYQYNTRDTFGFAMKATYVEKRVEGNFSMEEGSVKLNYKTEGFEIFKDPVTDSGMKKSAKGLLKVLKTADTGEYFLVDQCSWEDVIAEDNELKIVFKDGEFVQRTTFDEIRERINTLLK